MTKIMILLATFLLLLTASTAFSQCAKIKDGSLTDVKGNPIKLGYDQYGYNYQAHMFNGLYENYTRPATVVVEGKVNLMMKWSDDWLSNQDCFGNDGKLDRGGDSSGISKGWLTNHEEGDYEVGGESFHYTYFVKIVYDGGLACGAAKDSCIWGVYTIIEEVMNDQGGAHGVDRSRLVNPAGVGFYTN